MAQAGSDPVGVARPDQKDYWDQWNQSWRFRDDYDVFMDRQRETALSVARKAGLRDARILDVGCGTGWLGNALLPFGRVWGTDLSPKAIEDGAHRYPELQLICGDFLKLDLPGPFDFIVSADAFGHMPDQAECVRKIAGLLRAGGTFLLMTQNKQVWLRKSTLRPLPPCVPHAHVRDWPSPGAIKAMLRPRFTIDRITTLDPGGDSGLLWWVENRYVRGGMGRLIGRERWRNLLEAARLGRELVIVARRR